MKKAYLSDTAAALLLILTIEAYFWTQGRTFAWDSPGVKIFLVFLYVVVGVTSQAAICFRRHCGIAQVLKANVFVAAVVSAGASVLALLLHPGVIKDSSPGWATASTTAFKFFIAIGLPTIAVRLGAAALALRRLRRASDAHSRS